MRKCSTLIIGSGESGMEIAEFMSQNNEYVIVCDESDLGGSYLTKHDLVLSDALKKSKEFEKHLHKFQGHSETYSVLKNYRKKILKEIQALEVDRLQEAQSEYTKNPNIEFMRGRARFISQSLVEINVKSGRELISFDRCVIAIGKQEVEIPYIEGIEDGSIEEVWDEYTIFSAKDLPKQLAVVGCTEDTLDFAFLYANLGIKVHIFEEKKADECLPHFDKTVLNVLFKKLLSKQVEFHFQHNVSEIKKIKKGIEVSSSAGASVVVSDVLLSTKKVFIDTVGANEIGLKHTSKGLVTTMDGRVFGGENIYAIGEANDKYDPGRRKEILNNALYAISQDLKKNQKPSKNRSTALQVSQINDAEYLKNIDVYPRIIGSFEGITIGITEHEARSLYGPVTRSEAYETVTGDIIKVVYNVQTDKIMGISVGGELSKECVLFATYCVDHKRKHQEFSSYVRNFLDLL
jgi:pyruvate/2-oxoglutarate dehydrogenase complex dihydrolipoamide dehydrogenase (E3) component